MRKIGLLPIVVLLVALSVGQTVYAADAYTDPDGQISFTPPDGYQQFTMQQIDRLAQLGTAFGGTPRSAAATRTAIITGYLDPLTMSNVIVATVPLPNPDVTLDEFIQASEDQLSGARLITFTPADTQDAMIGGEAARAFEYTLMTGSVTVRGRQYYVIHNDAVYLLTLSASEDVADQAFSDMQVVVDSFMFLQ